MVYRESRYEAEYEAIKEMIEENQYNLSVAEMCEAAKVKRTSYYKWLHHKKSNFDIENEEIVKYIMKYDEMFDHTLGYRAMTDRINRDENKNYNDKRIYKIMNTLGIQSIIRRNPHSCTVRRNNNTADNILKRDFNATAPNQKWVTDVTEFKYGDRNQYKLYLCAFMDLYDRTLVGYEIGDSNNNILVYNSFNKAVSANPGAHPMVHSDGGYQYTSPSFVHMLNELEMIQSMSRVHCCIDNGPMEGFWGILKCEAYKNRHFDTKEELENMINGWIQYYTYIRYQRRFGIRTPYEVRTEALNNNEPAYYPIPVNKRLEKYKLEHYGRTDFMSASV